jgi:hypothetical protein
MSNKEIYAWTSVSTSAALLIFFLTYTFGWPELLTSHTEQINSVLWKVLIGAFLVELILELVSSINEKGVMQDERDRRIEAKGYKNAYQLLMVGLLIIIGHTVAHHILQADYPGGQLMGMSYYSFHMIVVVLFSANILKAGTQLYFYRRGF